MNFFELCGTKRGGKYLVKNRGAFGSLVLERKRYRNIFVPMNDGFQSVDWKFLANRKVARMVWRINEEGFKYPLDEYSANVRPFNVDVAISRLNLGSFKSRRTRSRAHANKLTKDLFSQSALIKYARHFNYKEGLEKTYQSYLIGLNKSEAVYVPKWKRNQRLRVKSKAIKRKRITEDARFSSKKFISSIERHKHLFYYDLRPWVFFGGDTLEERMGTRYHPLNLLYKYNLDQYISNGVPKDLVLNLGEVLSVDQDLYSYLRLRSSVKLLTILARKKRGVSGTSYYLGSKATGVGLRGNFREKLWPKFELVLEKWLLFFNQKYRLCIKNRVTRSRFFGVNRRHDPVKYVNGYVRFRRRKVRRRGYRLRGLPRKRSGVFLQWKDKRRYFRYNSSIYRKRRGRRRVGRDDPYFHVVGRRVFFKNLILSKFPFLYLKLFFKYSLRGVDRSKNKLGRIYFRPSRHNIYMTLTDVFGKVIVSMSCGNLGIVGPKKRATLSSVLLAKAFTKACVRKGYRLVSLIFPVGTERRHVSSLNAVVSEGLRVSRLVYLPKHFFKANRSKKLRRKRGKRR